MLQQENAELQSKLEIENEGVDKQKILLKKYRELKDGKQHDTAEVCNYNTLCFTTAQ